MVMAAGLGVRMRPLSLATPKPLIAVHGKAMIDYAFDHLRRDGCSRAVVNVHYLAGQIEAWVRRQVSPEIVISDERAALLDTGGGLVKALPLLGPDPFFVLNSDSFWTDAGEPALARLRAAWDGDRMDCLLLLAPPGRTVGYDGKGDFNLNGDGTLTRRGGEMGAALVYIGGYLVHPRLFADAPKGAFSMNILWDRAIAQGRLFGLSHDGRWFHVGTPEAIPLAERALDSQA
ncbi:nucleotidyltransferase family protein [soil metagenome]